jgi:uncharacterized LabA/DUF88 family protein
MSKKPITYAFIDAQNLNLGILYNVTSESGKLLYKGQKLDYRRFRHYLREKFNVTEAYLFIGYVPENEKIYDYLKSSGYTLIFKEITEFTNADGTTVVKGNVDTDIVLYSAAIKYPAYDQAIIVSGDGDFLSLYQFLDEKHKLARILVPNQFRYSKLLRRYKSKIFFISNQKSLFTKKDHQKTRSSGRITSLGVPGHRDKPILPNPRPKVNPPQRQKIRQPLSKEDL